MKKKPWIFEWAIVSLLLLTVSVGYGAKAPTEQAVEDFEAWLDRVYLRTVLNHTMHHAYIYVDQTEWKTASPEWQARAIPRFICPFTVNPRSARFRLPATYALYSVPWQGGVPTKLVQGNLMACQKEEQRLPRSWTKPREGPR